MTRYKRGIPPLINSTSYIWIAILLHLILRNRYYSHLFILSLFILSFIYFIYIYLIIYGKNQFRTTNILSKKKLSVTVCSEKSYPFIFFYFILIFLLIRVSFLYIVKPFQTIYFLFISFFIYSFSFFYYPGSYNPSTYL